MIRQLNYVQQPYYANIARKTRGLECIAAAAALESDKPLACVDDDFFTALGFEVEGVCNPPTEVALCRFLAWGGL